MTRLLALLILLASPAAAHQAQTGWDYDEQAQDNCCGDRDCRRIVPGEVVFTAGGWLVSPPPGFNPIERVLTEGDGRIKTSGDQWMHICYNRSKTYIRCLFVPSGKG